MKKPTATAHFPPDSDPNPTRKCRRVPSPRVRLRRSASAAGGRRGFPAPTTPLIKWRHSDAGPENGSSAGSDKDPPPPPQPAKVSARKLAAGIWMGAQTNFHDNHSSALHTNTKKYLHMPIFLNDPKNECMHKLQASAALPNSSMERATKWDIGYYGHSKVSSLQSELEQARNRLTELENDRQSTKKKLDHFLRKLSEEKESWRRKEHEKVRAVVDSIKDDLHRERKARQRMEIMNSKLVNELNEVKTSAKRFMQDYEKEKKARELMEDVCEELAKEISENKAEVEEIKNESMRNREEVDEERKMLQMAEVWREERVQMKLIDAKVTLEAKFSELSNLQYQIESFLRGRNKEKEQAEFLKEAADIVMDQEINDFSYQPPLPSENIFSVFEELQPKEEKKTESCYSDDDSGWETVSHASNSLDGSDPSVNGICEESNASDSGTDIEVFSSNTKQSRNKSSSIKRLWRSSCPNNGEILSPDMSSPSVGQWSSPDSVNPHINRGMKGCIEWPRGAQKYSLKAKLLEARMESQKIQLRQALKQKI